MLKKRVVHCKGADPWDIYVGRPSPFGNPWSHKRGTLAKFKTKTVREAVNNFEVWLDGTGFRDVLQEERRKILEQLPHLVGKTLACWCEPDSPCHGKVIADRAAKLEEVDGAVGTDEDATAPRPPS